MAGSLRDCLRDILADRKRFNVSLPPNDSRTYILLALKKPPQSIRMIKEEHDEGYLSSFNRKA